MQRFPRQIHGQGSFRGDAIPPRSVTWPTQSDCISFEEAERVQRRSTGTHQSWLGSHDPVESCGRERFRPSRGGNSQNLRRHSHSRGRDFHGRLERNESASFGLQQTGMFEYCTWSLISEFLQKRNSFPNALFGFDQRKWTTVQWALHCGHDKAIEASIYLFSNVRTKRRSHKKVRIFFAFRKMVIFLSLCQLRFREPGDSVLAHVLHN